MILPSTLKVNGCRKPVWLDIADRFHDDRDCLAAFIALESAEVLEALKPSSLVCLSNRPRRCGKNLYAIWKRYGASIFRESRLECMVLREKPDSSVLLLIYEREALIRLVSRKSVRCLLSRFGYDRENGVDCLLAQLAFRFSFVDIPHEIGVILGYPLKDVAGFMGVKRLRFSCQGPWRIYGNPRKSLLLAEAYRQCRCRMADRLIAGDGPLECLEITRVTPVREQLEFCPYDENVNQNQLGGSPCASH
ncbi:MAG TPA: DUF3793 family protein [Geobacteraceae bacterium]|nr:DUF3793 family protein [Geobacteraceae bacterium]